MSRQLTFSATLSIAAMAIAALAFQAGGGSATAADLPIVLAPFAR